MSVSFPDDIITLKSIAKGTGKGSAAANMMSKAIGHGECSAAHSRALEHAKGEESSVEGGKAQFNQDRRRNWHIIGGRGVDIAVGSVVAGGRDNT